MVCFRYLRLKATQKIGSIPVVVSGGAGSSEDVLKCMKTGNVDSVAIASVLHYNKRSIPQIKDKLVKNKVSVRKNGIKS